MPSPLPVAEFGTPVGADYGPEIRRARPLLGTLVEIRAAGQCSATRLHAAIDAAFAAIERVQRLMSNHDPASDLARINRTAFRGDQQVDPETYAVIGAALRFAALSDGAFDPCVGDCLEKWGYLPPNAPAADLGPATGGHWRDVRLLEAGRVRYTRPLRLDLGGIAKGYAVDRAVQTLQGAGVERILVNAGGDLRTSGPWEQRVRLRHPQAPGLNSELLRLSNAALATSAAYYSRRRLSFGDVSELLDPRSRRPYLENGSASVRAADCMSADALTKVVLFATAPVAEQALATCNAVAFVYPPLAATG